MDIFKTGIITWTGCFIGCGANECYQELMENHNIDASTNDFVKIKLLPQNNKWWLYPAFWDVLVEERTLPEWYEKDAEKYNWRFIDKVTNWWMQHVIVDTYIEGLNSGFYLLKRCKIGCLYGNIHVILDECKVNMVYDNAVIENMYGETCIEQLSADAQIWERSEGAIAYDMHGIIMK